MRKRKIYSARLLMEIEKTNSCISSFCIKGIRTFRRKIKAAESQRIVTEKCFCTYSNSWTHCYWKYEYVCTWKIFQNAHCTLGWFCSCTFFSFDALIKTMIGSWFSSWGIYYALFFSKIQNSFLYFFKVCIITRMYTKVSLVKNNN